MTLVRWSCTIALLASSGLGCLRQTSFHCADNAQCGSAGVCEAEGFCSFIDSNCEGGRRFGDSAGPLANQCVGGTPGIDGRMPDGPVDMSLPMGCPGDYTDVAGATAGHKYKTVNPGVDWLTAHDACASESSSAYLFIPDDSSELAALGAVVTGEYWIGVDDRTTENTFVNARGQPQTFLPWASGEPRDNMGGKDCVRALNATEFATDKCNFTKQYVCECEP